jgi:N-acetylglucosamine malate deacetylase 1
MANILVVSCHADDEVLGVGATIAEHSDKGDEVYLVSLCDRSMNHKLDLSQVERLRNCLSKVSSILGIKEIIYGELTDERMDLVKATDIIGKAIETYKPSIVYTHSDIDINQDHRVALHATSIATRTYQKDFVQKVYSYEVPSSTEQGVFSTRRFAPNTYVDVTNSINKKLEAMQVYTEEIFPYPYPRSQEGLLALSRVRGMEIGVEHAEAFELLREKVTL